MIKSALAAISFLLDDCAELRSTPFSTRTFLPRFLSHGISQRTIWVALSSWYLATKPTVRIIDEKSPGEDEIIIGQKTMSMAEKHRVDFCWCFYGLFG